MVNQAIELTTTTTTMFPYDVSRGCSRICYPMRDGKTMVLPHYFQVAHSIKDAEIGEAIFRHQLPISENLLLHELPDGKRFEKHRVAWAGTLKDAWVRVK